MDYKSSGVNIQAGYDAVERIKPMVSRTFNANVLTGLGQFSSFFELPSGYKRPVLVSSADGVGTKLKVATQSDRVETVGIDLVAMCVNDLICCGATPLYFLDYIAVHALDPLQVEHIMEGMVEGCRIGHLALIGGEMAEMNDMYRPGDFDLAGFSVGIVEKDALIDGTKIQPGDTVYALPSSGLHSNGFSLVRRVLSKTDMNKVGLSIDDLLTPTRIYVDDILTLISSVDVHGIAHITGGGMMGNIQRILPEGVALDIDMDAIQTPDIFHKIQTAGDIPITEMRRVFNMGVGMVIIASSPLPDSVVAYPIGSVIRAA